VARKFKPHNEHALVHARGISYYDLKEMKLSLERAHKLFGKINTLYDRLYLLEVIDYGTLQRNYKCGSG